MRNHKSSYPFFVMKKLLLFAILSGMTLSLKAMPDIYVCIFDSSGTPTNIRNSPNGQIVKSLPLPEGGYAVTLLAEKNGWWKIAPVIDVYGGDEYEIPLNGSATGYWIHNSVLGFTIAGDPTDAIRQRPSKNAKAVTIPVGVELQFHPVAIKGNWVKAVSNDGRLTGWLHRDRICYNPLTTCP